MPQGATFGIHDHVALVPFRLLERLPGIGWQRHVTAVEAANEALSGAGLPGPAVTLAGSLAGA